MKLKINILLVGLCCYFLSNISNSIAQQLPQYTQWSSHQFAINPAHAGIKNCLDVHSLYRAQWLGFDGAPKSGFLTIAAPINGFRKHAYSPRHGVGAKIETDRIGPFSSLRLNLAYAAHFNFTADNRLSLGLYGGIVQFGYSAQNAVTIQPDPTVMRETNFIKPDATFGAWWNGKNYYFGLVLQNLIGSKWNNIGDNSKFKFHSILNGGYRYSIHEKLTFLPAFIMRIPPAGPMSLDLNLSFDYMNQVGFGIGYRNTDAFLFMAHCKVKSQLTINYSFDFITSAMRPKTFNTHEVSLIFSTCKPQDLRATKCSMFE